MGIVWYNDFFLSRNATPSAFWDSRNWCWYWLCITWTWWKASITCTCVNWSWCYWSRVGSNWSAWCWLRINCYWWCCNWDISCRSNGWCWWSRGRRCGTSTTSSATTRLCWSHVSDNGGENDSVKWRLINIVWGNYWVFFLDENFDRVLFFSFLFLLIGCSVKRSRVVLHRYTKEAVGYHDRWRKSLFLGIWKKCFVVILWTFSLREVGIGYNSCSNRTVFSNWESWLLLFVLKNQRNYSKTIIYLMCIEQEWLLAFSNP